MSEQDPRKGMPTVQNEALRELLLDIFRPNSSIGDGSLGDVVRYECATGHTVAPVRRSEKRLPPRYGAREALYALTHIRPCYETVWSSFSSHGEPMDDVLSYWSDCVRIFVRRCLENSCDELMDLSALLEAFQIEGDDQVEWAATQGFLEGVVNRFDLRTAEERRVLQHLGPESRAYIDAYNAFHGTPERFS